MYSVAWQSLGVRLASSTDTSLNSEHLLQAAVENAKGHFLKAYCHGLDKLWKWNVVYLYIL
jgi:hypothetical protein